MSELIEFEEEEFDTKFNGQTIRRLGQAADPLQMGRAWLPVHGYGRLGAGFVLHLPKRTHYRRRHHRQEHGGADADSHPVRRTDPGAGGVCLRLHLPGRHPGRAYSLRPAQVALPSPADAVAVVLQPDARGLDHQPRDVGHGPRGRAGDLGLARRDLVDIQHRHGAVLHVEDQLAVDADRDADRAGHHRGGDHLPAQDHRAVPRGAPDQLEDHRRRTTRRSRACA